MKDEYLYIEIGGYHLPVEEIINDGLSFKGMKKEEAKKRFLDLSDRLNGISKDGNEDVDSQEIQQKGP